jgi:hypothetical protein
MRNKIFGYNLRHRFRFAFTLLFLLFLLLLCILIENSLFYFTQIKNITPTGLHPIFLDFLFLVLIAFITFIAFRFVIGLALLFL